MDSEGRGGEGRGGEGRGGEGRGGEGRGGEGRGGEGTFRAIASCTDPPMSFGRVKPILTGRKITGQLVTLDSQ